ncbi:hypothetical protein ACWGKQ_44650, partial [Streptomyces sp. NPDC054770]
MSSEARHAPIPRRPSPDPAPTDSAGEPAPTADGTLPGNGGTGVTGGNGANTQGDGPHAADASRRVDRPGFFDRPNRMNRSQRPDVSTGGADITGQDQLPGRPGGQQSRDDRTSRGGAVGQGEQSTGDRAVGRQTSAERIVRPRHPNFRPPQGPPSQGATTAAPPPPASARFPDTPPAPSDRGTGHTAPFRLSYGSGPSPRRVQPGSEPTVPPRPLRTAQDAEPSSDERREAAGPSAARPGTPAAPSGGTAGDTSGAAGPRRFERPRGDFPATGIGTPDSGSAWSPHLRTFPVPTAPPRPTTPPKA